MEKLNYIGKATDLPFEQIWSYKTLKECESIFKPSGITDRQVND